MLTKVKHIKASVVTAALYIVCRLYTGSGQKQVKGLRCDCCLRTEAGGSLKCDVAIGQNEVKACGVM